MSNDSFGGAIFTDIDRNPYLNELYDNILYNYSLTVFKRGAEKKIVDCEAALRFADLLSHSKSDRHRIWAQEIVALLHLPNPTIKLSSIIWVNSFECWQLLRNVTYEKHISQSQFA